MKQSLRNPLGERFTFSHDAAGRRTVDRLVNCTRASFVFGNADRLTQLINRNAGGTVIPSSDYLVDNVGNRQRATNARESLASRRLRARFIYSAQDDPKSIVLRNE